ncbi:MAG: hypothetical protein [Wendovervirus sonii]|uniref:Uncharacterized protein n=1 Tax=phage Lak_Megaphage_Sonny TaxID=3109229 RepID=A0ABZ0Z680_9CAUD|nr:MAG: hypothetical protein [phage Lak_Megaphage_Sonny]
MKEYKKFTKAERSSFPYWFAHWRAYNSTAKNCKGWKLKYLFHDVEKPFLKLFMDYKKVQKIHRGIAPHHIEYVRDYWLHVYNVPENREDMLNALFYIATHFFPDIEGMIIDWECSRFTKASEPLNAMEEWERVKHQRIDKLFDDMETGQKFVDWLEPIMQEKFKKLGLK